jgi:hypothetical protein
VQCVWFPINASTVISLSNLVVLLFNKVILFKINGQVLGLEIN